jgi:hypothetical protein
VCGQLDSTAVQPPTASIIPKHDVSRDPQHDEPQALNDEGVQTPRRLRIAALAGAVGGGHVFDNLAVPLGARAPHARGLQTSTLSLDVRLN